MKEELLKVLKNKPEYIVPLITGSITIYDLIRSSGVNSLKTELNNEFQENTVNVKKYVNDQDSSVKIIDDEEKVDKLLKRMEGNPIKNFLLKNYFKQSIEGDNTNAFVDDEGKGYIIGKGDLPPEIIEHELGHIKDYQKRGKKPGEVKEYGETGLRSTFRNFFKPYYKKTVIPREQKAWDYVKDTARKKSFEERALKTYDKGFHRARATNMGAMTAVALSQILRSRLK